MRAKPKPIQCSTGPFWAFELDHCLDLIAEAGFTDIELMVTRDRRTHHPEIPARLAAERGLKVASLHGPFLAITKTVWGQDPMGKVTRGVEMCRELGADTYVVHPPFLWERRFARWIEAESEAYSSEQGVRVAVETMYPVWMAGRRMRAYRWLDPAALAAAAPIVALDTSHVTVARHDILDSYRALEDRLVHIHLSNNAGDGRDGHLELEQGILPLDRFLGQLHQSNYGGAVSLEVSVRRFIEKPKELVAMLRRNREYVEDRMSGTGRVTKGMPRPR
ncbi:MAG TPA: sugar phosphate isomerase/epimerase family protein [Actinomycetota bacterium]|nr:sugar phosphate isomerase/epimerase family protein [Actinomycetota bacterium]